MAFLYLIGRKGNIPVDDDLPVNIGDAESKRPFSETALRLEIVKIPARQRNKFALVVEVFKCLDWIAVIADLYSAPERAAADLIFIAHGRIICGIKWNDLPRDRHASLFDGSDERERIGIEIEVTFFALGQQVCHEHIDRAELARNLQICAGELRTVIVREVHSSDPVVSGNRVEHGAAALIAAAVKGRLAGMYRAFRL